MPITIDGTGSITGLSAGGLPNGCITAPELDGAQSGSAPIYGARAWVCFNGTGVVAISASGNVTSVTDNGTGQYTVNFTAAISDANYATLATCGDSVANYTVAFTSSNATPTTSAVRVQTVTQNGGNPTAFDTNRVSVAIFR